MIENSDIESDKRIRWICHMSTRLEGMPEHLKTADEFRGNPVVDREGIRYGKVKHIHINSDTLSVAGVTVHQGFHKDYYLSNDSIDKFTEKTLLLSTPPVRVGVQVVDIDGTKIGKVKKLHRHPDTNELEYIEIPTGLLHKKLISKSDIWGIGEKIILNFTKKEFSKLK